MNPLVVRCGAFTKSGSFSLPSRAFSQKSALFSQRLISRKTLQLSWKQHQRRTYSNTTQPPLKGDLGFNDNIRNGLYVAGAVVSVLAVGGLCYSLNSDWFERKLYFDEENPEKWPVQFLELIAAVAQMDRYSVKPKYLELLKRGAVYKKSEEVQRSCCAALGTLAQDKKLNKEIAESIPLPQILHSLRTAQSVEFLASVLDMMQVLSERGANAPILLTKQSMPLLAEMCHHPKEEVKSKLSGLLANLSRNEDVTESMVRLIPPMYTLYQRSTDSYTKEGATIALRNILNSKDANQKYSGILQTALTNAKIPEAELNAIKEYKEESSAAWRLKSLGVSLVIGCVYSGVRWTIHGTRNGVKGAQLVSLLKDKTPKSLVGVAAVYLYGSFDDWFFNGLLEPSLNSETALLSCYTASSIAFFGVLWASQALAPFTVLPAAIYPTYKLVMTPERRYYEK